jgi:hypothetical protein
MTHENDLTATEILALTVLSCALSPENLYCDGEISHAEAQRKYTRLMKEWRALEQKVGRTVTEDEVWAREMGR